MKLKDVLIVSVASLVAFPIMMVVTLYTTGFMQVKFGWQEKKEEAKPTVEIIKYSPYQESLFVAHSKSFKALEAQRMEIDRKAAKLREDEERIKDLQKELDIRTSDIDKTRKRLEELVTKSNELEERRIKQLANVYGSMRAEEAAPILYTLQNDMIVRIMQNIGDNRQKAKLLSAMGNLSKERAGAISKLMGQAGTLVGKKGAKSK